MKVLIIGSAGFIGSFLTKRLTEKGYEVRGMDINPGAAKENLSDFILGDILKPKTILQAAQGTDAIIHLAAKHHDFGISREKFYDVNVGGMKNILDCATQLGIKKILFYSTVAVYGDVETFSMEDTPTNPASVYGETKLAAEKELNNWIFQDNSRQATIIRPTVVFGPGNYANMYNLINSIYKKRFIFVGKGENIKSVAYVENIVDATIFLLGRLHKGIEICNYSDYPQMSTKDIVKTITRYLGCNIPNFAIPLKPALALAGGFDALGRITGYNFPITAKRIKKFNTGTQHNSDKIRSMGFRPSVGLSDGFKRMVEWYLSYGKDNSPGNKSADEGES